MNQLQGARTSALKDQRVSQLSSSNRVKTGEGRPRNRCGLISKNQMIEVGKVDTMRQRVGSRLAAGKKGSIMMTAEMVKTHKLASAYDNQE